MDPRRAALLEAMDLHRFVRRGGPNDRPVRRQEVVAPASVPSSVAPAPTVPRKTVSASADGVRAPRVAPKPSAPSPAAVTAELPPDRAGLDWLALREAVAACRRCGLGDTRTQTVFGVGVESARWMVVGEAPGADEDRQGEPFVGRAGQLLNAMLASVGQPRDTVYIANVLKCRPPANRPPQAAEVTQCLPNLHRQIELVNPDLVLCFGRVAAQALLGLDVPLTQMRGRLHRLPGSQRPVVVTYHPAYLLRSPSEKRKAWADLKFAVEVAHGRGA